MITSRIRLHSRLPHRCSPYSHRRLISSSTAGSLHRRRWGLVSDIHFQEYELSRVVSTSNWVLETFRQQKPELTSIICLGDILNTKENVNLQALSATIQFFAELRKIAPVHVLLGNHDLNLRGGMDGNLVSSLDWLDRFGYGDYNEGYPCRVYRTLARTVIDGHDCVMVPWHENHYDVIDGISKIYPEIDSRRDTVVFGHLAIAGAAERWRERTRSKISASELNQGHLRGFKACWMGHFHHHQILGTKNEENGEFIRRSNTGYVGAPMQHHFGDIGDKERGIVILDVDEVEQGVAEGSTFPAFEFLRYPAWDLFREVTLGKLQSFEETVGDTEWESDKKERLKQHIGFDPQGKRIQIFYRALDSYLFEEWREKLISMGALDVRRRIDQGSLLFQSPGESVAAAPQSEDSTKSDMQTGYEEEDDIDGQKTYLSEEYIPPPSFIEMVEPFVKAVVEKSKPTKPDEAIKDTSVVPEDMLDYYISNGRSIMQRSDQIVSLSTDNSPVAGSDDAAKSSLPVFTATPQKLIIANFLGVQGTLIIPFNKLSHGTYFLQGPNGSGKSTLLEALTWCLFGKCIRTNMSAADVVNDVVKPIRTARTRGPGKVTALVKLEFENGYVVERSRKGEGGGASLLKVYFQGQEYKTTQECLERDIIGADYETFVRSIVFGGGGGELTGSGRAIGGATVDFLGLEKDKRRELIEDLLGMGRFEGYAAVAKERKKAIEQKWEKLKITRKFLEDRMGQLEEKKEQFEKQIEPQRRRLEKLEMEMAELEAERSKFDEDRKRTEEEQGEAIKWNDVYNTLEKIKETKERLDEQQIITEEAKLQLDALLELKPTQALIENLNSVIRTNERAVSEAESSVKRLKDTKMQKAKELQRLEKNIQEKTCPTCQQTLPPKNLDIISEHVEKTRLAIETTETKIMDTESELQDLRELIFENENKKSEALSTLSNLKIRDERHLVELTSPTRERELRKIYDSHRKSLQNVTRYYESVGARNLPVLLQGRTHEEIAILAQREEGDTGNPAFLNQYQLLLKRIQDLSVRHSVLSNSLVQLSTQISLTEGQLEKTSAELIVCKAELGTCLSEFPDVEKEMRVSSFWEMAFSSKRSSTTLTPNMRSYLLESSISALNALIAAHMDILASPESKDRLSITLSPDLNIVGSGIRAYGKRSSGQRKRNNLAVLFALFRLVRQKCRFRPEFIMLDEVFDALDKDGKRAAGELASGTGVKYVFIVTHAGKEDIGAGAGVIGLDGTQVESGRSSTGGPWVIQVQMTEHGTMMWDDAREIKHIPYGEELSPEDAENA